MTSGDPVHDGDCKCRNCKRLDAPITRWQQQVERIRAQKRAQQQETPVDPRLPKEDD